MKEDDPLQSVLREWEAPETSSALDARVRASYSAIHRPSRWRRILFARITIPVPVLAALLLVVTTLWFAFRPRPPQAQPATFDPGNSGYLTRLEATGFRPLQDGATRVIRSGELKR